MMRSALLGVAMLVAACGPSVDGICEDLAETCPEQNVREQSCVLDGDQLEEEADDADCDDDFEDYLECLEEHLCSWETACAHPYNDVTSCIAGN